MKSDTTDREYDGHDASECYACDGTGELEDGAQTYLCICPCHDRDDDE